MWSNKNSKTKAIPQIVSYRKVTLNCILRYLGIPKQIEQL